VRLGVYSDLLYRAEGDMVSARQAFIGFVTQLPPRVEEMVVFGRVDPEPGRSHYLLPPEVRFVRLPHYPRVTSVAGQVRAVRRTAQIFATELERLDAVWIFGPHPIALALALTARRRGVSLFLGVRQDYPTYIAGRLPSPKWAWAVPVAHTLEWAFRRLAQSAPTVAVGDELAHRYAAGRAPVLSTGFSLVRADDIVDEATALGRTEGFARRILSVGRLDPEKNPLLLAEILRRLRSRDSRWRLTVAGDGPLAAELRRRVEEVGVADAVDFAGYVAQGEALRALYRSHDVFLHVSRTEGFPQVLFEAQAAGRPVVATAVGGVPAAVGASENALLVPPDDAAAAAAGLERVAEDAALRRRLVSEGLRNARANTAEAQLDRIAEFFGSRQAESSRPRYRT
jgi:glycosyltransferase involved in cell wall biosynthesis